MFIYLLCLCLFLQTSAIQRLPVLQRYIGKSGFHRDLVTTVTFPADLIPEATIDVDVECYLLFTETIPTGAYVDPDQTKSLKPYGGADVLLTAAVDVEKPEFESKEFQGHVFSNLSKVDDIWISGYTLPVHLRYHAVSRQDYTNVTFPNPEVALRCKNKILGMTHHGYHGESVRQKSEMCSSSSVILCDWVVIQYDADQMNITVEVPVGRLEHYVLVTAGTVLTTLSGCVFLIYHSLQTQKTTKVS